MDKVIMLKLVKELPFDVKKTAYTEDDVSVYLFRPSSLSKRFKEYDVKHNFQIWIKEGKRAFRPNHLRVFIDLNLRIRSRPDLKNELLRSFDAIFYGADPEKALSSLAKEEFEHYLNSLIVTGYLAQLFLIEQEYAYHRESKFNPGTLFFQGWVRQFLDSPKEIDNLCMAVCSRQPPMAKYTCKEDKNNKKYSSKRNELWYLDA
jgi:hypothetical protein